MLKIGQELKELLKEEILEDKGWDYIVGNGTTQISKTIYFDQAYDTPPLVFVTFIGARPVSEGTPAHTSDFNTSWGSFTGAYVRSTRTNGFTISLTASANHSANYNFGFVWHVIE